LFISCFIFIHLLNYRGQGKVEEECHTPCAYSASAVQWTSRIFCGGRQPAVDSQPPLFMRLDVTTRNLKEIDGVLDFLKEAKIKNVNVTHIQDNDTDPLVVANELLKKRPGLDVMLHLSAKRFCDRSVEDGRMAFRKKFEEARGDGIRKFLIISGHPRGTFDTLDALQLLQSQQLARDTEIYCAYNPYFDPARLREENERLQNKLAHGFVKGICLQIGMDTAKLAKGVEYVRSISPGIHLYGSVPVPSEGTLNRLKLVALYGVFLPNSYLLSVASAKEMTSELMRAFKSHRIEPIVFSPHIRDLSEAMPLFR